MQSHTESLAKRAPKDHPETILIILPYRFEGIILPAHNQTHHSIFMVLHPCYASVYLVSAKPPTGGRFPLVTIPDALTLQILDGLFLWSYWLCILSYRFMALNEHVGAERRVSTLRSLHIFSWLDHGLHTRCNTSEV